MRHRGTLQLATIIGVGWAAEARAQQIPEFVFGLVLSPVILIVLSIVLALVSKSWKLGLKSILVGIFWVSWFILASIFLESDPIIWAPIIGLGAHLIVLVVFLGWRLVSKILTYGRSS
jgi:hypothetical protein